MNVAAHQEKEKSEKTGKRKAGEERRQADFEEAACYSSAVVQRAARRKIICVRGVPGVTGTLGKANNHLTQPKRGWGPHYHVEAAVDWCSSILLSLHVYSRLYIRQKSRTSLSIKIGVNTCFGDGQKVRNDD